MALFQPAHHPLPSPTDPPVEPLEPPFRIRVEHRDVDARGTFRPEAHVSFAAPLRLSGLLAALPPEAVRDLVLLLTFVTPNGHCAPALHQIAHAMRLSQSKARSRLERLEALRFGGQPLLVHAQSQSGLELFSPRPWLAPAHEDAKLGLPHSTSLPLRAASREAVIEHSRAAYARPREEVEREIEAQLGYERDERGQPHRMAGSVTARVAGRATGRATGDRASQQAMPARPAPEPVPLSAKESAEEVEARREREELRALLLGVGLLPEQAQALLDSFDPVRIRRQVMWLPHRRAKNPAGMLLAAVKDDYEAPPLPQRAKATAHTEMSQKDAPPVSEAMPLGELNGSSEIALEMPASVD